MTQRENPLAGFGVICADNPWQFESYSGPKVSARARTSQYPVMTLERLKSLPVQQLLAKDACVFMWAVMSLLPEAIEVGQAWGLTYKTCAFTWVKTTRLNQELWFGRPVTPEAWHMGMGYWTRANPELCLLFTQGSPKRKAANIRELLVSPVSKHSAKPEAAQDRIEQLVDGPYLELFARRERPGWTCIGNEISGNDIVEDMAGLTAESGVA